MNNLYIINETLTNGFYYYLIIIITILSLLCGIYVIIAKNPIVSVLFLIGLFISIAGYLMMLGMNFIGLSYLLVYVGAVSILFLFILMLINVRISELTNENTNSIVLGIVTGLLFAFTLHKLLPKNNNFSNYIFKDNILNINDVFNFIAYYLNLTTENNLLFVSSKHWDGVLAAVSHITSIGNVIYTTYPILLILTSLILLLAMVGAIIITIKQQ